MPLRTRPPRKLLIRPLETHDIVSVCELSRLTLTEQLQWTPRELTAYCKKHKPFGLGAFYQDQLTGFLIGLDDAEPVLELIRFATHPEFQQKRIATRLFHHLLDLYPHAYTMADRSHDRGGSELLPGPLCLSDGEGW